MKLVVCAPEHPHTRAVACLRMVAQHYGIPKSEAELAVSCGTTANGTTPAGPVRAAGQIGLSATIAYGDLSVLQAAVDLQRPAIVFLGLLASKSPSQLSIHAVVVTGIDRQNVTFVDPADGLEHVCDRASFLAGWQRASGISVLITRP